MRAGHLPFAQATASDPYYRCFVAGKYDSYWRLMEKNKDEGFFSDSFKDLVTALFQPDPNKRPNIDMIRQHVWLNGDIEEVSKIKLKMKDFLTTKYESVRERFTSDECERNNLSEGANDAAYGAFKGRKVYRSGPGGE
jgi:serine/threonine protein kinase